MRRPLSTIVLCVLAMAAAVGACGGSSGTSGSAPSTTEPSGHATQVNAPSTSAKMICEDEAVEDIEEQIGVGVTQAPVPNWVDHVYACRYTYANGTMLLSVKELVGSKQTDAYYASLRKQLGVKEQLSGLGDGAFLTKTGNVVVRKDDKVLVVDIQDLPATFGTPPALRSDVAINVAVTIMGCWTGA